MEEDAPRREIVAPDMGQELDRIRGSARQSIGRGSLFGLLAIAATIGAISNSCQCR